MNYPKALEYLYELRTFGTKLGLENTRKLAKLAGNPQNKLRFIHVAGTNGKGSTCAMLESIYRAAGFRTGLYTSPHLVSFRERLQVNRELITETEVARWVDKLRDLTEEFPEKSHPTFFEVSTVMALRYFVKKKCDVVIWETGLGGRLDATNIVTPLASVITNIEVDHAKWLGQTPLEIAREKAGIIKQDVPLITSEADPGVFSILAEEAARKNSPVTRVQRPDAKRAPLDKARLPLIGDHQEMNAALAFATARVLSSHLPVNQETAVAGLRQVHWPGRFQVIRPGIGRDIVLDCAHNPAGATALRAALQKRFGSVLASFVFGVMQDKDWVNIFRILVPLAGRICLAPVRSSRSADTQVLQQHCQQLNPYAEVIACEDAPAALKRTEHDSLVVVTGSSFIVGEALEALQLSPVPIKSERGLNDSSTNP